MSALSDDGDPLFTLFEVVKHGSGYFCE
jgi:hypothetical protein